MLPSWVLLALIVFDGAVVVIANTFYPLAKAQEAKERLASDARAILMPEIRGNATFATTMRAAREENNIPLGKFDVTAWETVSKGGLLLGLKPEEITKFLHMYRLVYQANDLMAQLLDAAIGVRSALDNARQTKQMFIGNLKATLDELQKSFAGMGIKTP
jgi:hypothetical protein